jgi:hypothetical protein
MSCVENAETGLQVGGESSIGMITREVLACRLAPALFLLFILARRALAPEALIDA